MLYYHSKNIERDVATQGLTGGMQLRALIMERDGLKRRIISEMPIEEIVKAATASERHCTLLSTLEVWQRLVHFSNGGQYRDILMVHLESLYICIEEAGGWPEAMSRVVHRNRPDEDTVFWPDHFRIKVGYRLIKGIIIVSQLMA